MFKFNFNPENTNDTKEDSPQAAADLLPSEEIFPNGTGSELTWDGIELSDTVVVLKGRVSDTDASKALQQEGVLHSDLIPGKYEGGFKLWEGGIDLARYLVDTVFFKPCSASLRVLELGCGHGIPGIVAMLAGATVDFQDYNEQVLEMLTYPSVMANWQANRSKQSPPPPVKYFSGDWGTLGALLKEINLVGIYDIIVTTETIYTLDGMNRLFQCIKQCLSKSNGVCYVAAKSFYFGVGGGIAAFVEMVAKDGEMKCEVVSTIEDGLSTKREILALRWV
ncbi:hypothetical protein Ndes2437B_g01729 [Nannochloris sp. 'desiccata']